MYHKYFTTLCSIYLVLTGCATEPQPQAPVAVVPPPPAIGRERIAIFEPARHRRSAGSDVGGNFEAGSAIGDAGASLFVTTGPTNR